MDLIPAATEMFLNAAFAGKLNKLKKFAEAIDHVIGDGIKSVIENTKDEEGRRAIHQAAARGRVNILKYLIEEIKLEDINVKAGSGETPLAYAAGEGHLATVEYLLEKGANPEIADDENKSPLHHAATRGRFQVMRGQKAVIPLLLSKGIDVDLTDDFGSPLHHAASAGEHDTVKVLLDHGANPNLVFHDTFTPLQASIHSQSRRCAEQLLKAGADPNGGPDGVKALLLAAEVGATEMIEELIEELDVGGAGPNLKKIVRGATQIIKLLVEAGADPNVTNLHGLKPIEISAMHGNRRAVEILLPVTSPIPSYVDWSTNGIMKHVNSKKFEKKMTRKSKTEESFLEAKSRGTSAFQMKKYWLAVYWYTEALGIKPDDAAVLSNRSLCYVYLDKGGLAFEDATQCVLARPDWPKAYYRAGVALKMLNELDDAADAFSRGLILDPQNKELEKAFREVSSNR